MADDWTYVDDAPAKAQAPSQPTAKSPTQGWSYVSPIPEQHLSAYHEGLWERFKDHYFNAAREAQAPGVNQSVTFTAGKLPSTEDYVGGGDNSPEALKTRAAARAIQDERDYREQYAAQGADDPWYKSPDGTLATGLTSVAGDIAGSLTNPVNYLGGGATRLGRMGIQAGIQAGANAANQGLSLLQGVQDKFSPMETALSGLIGGILGGGDLKPGRAEDIQEKFDAGASAEDILKEHPDLDPKKVDTMVKYRNAGGKGAKFVDAPPEAANSNPEQSAPSGIDRLRGDSPGGTATDKILDDLHSQTDAFNAVNKAYQKLLDAPFDTPEYEAAAKEVAEAEANYEEVRKRTKKTTQYASNDDDAFSATRPNELDPVLRGKEAPAPANSNAIGRDQLNKAPDESDGPAYAAWLGQTHKMMEDETAAAATRARGFLRQQGVVNADSVPDQIAIQMHERMNGPVDIIEKRAIVDTLNHLTSEPVQAGAGEANAPSDWEYLFEGPEEGGSGGKPPEPPATPPGGEGPPEEPIRPKYIQNVNVDKGGYSPEHDPYLAKAVEDANLDPQTHSQTIADAHAMRQEMSPEELATFDPLKSEAVAHSVALRAQLHEAVADATRLAADLKDPTKDTTATQHEFDQAMNIAGLTGHAVTEGASFAGRLLNAHGIRVGKDGAYAKGVAALGKDYTADMRAEIAEQVLIFKDNPEMISKLAKKLLAPTLKDKIVNALNIPRALMSSFDLSAPFRQGLGLVGRKEYWNSFGSMLKQFGSEEAHAAAQQAIRDDPNFPLMRKGGLYLAGDRLSTREEAFMSSYAEHIPVIGRGVRASERAYAGFLNKVRADTFSSLVEDMKAAGIDLVNDPTQLKDLARFINTSTGRGSLGRANDAAPIMSAVFFSPRLIASRVQMLNPGYYVGLSPFARKEAVKSLLAVGAFGVTTLGLAKMGGLGVEVDPRSSDFGKIKVGNTRYDPLGGFGQYLRFATEMAKNQKTSADGRVETLGSKYGQPNRLNVLEDFLVSKTSPVTSFVADYLRGKDAGGQPFTMKKEIADRFVPMVIQDIVDVYKDGGAAKAAVSAVPDTFGIAVQDYQPNGLAKKLGAKADDPVLKELTRLQQTTDTTLLGGVNSTAKLGNKSFALTPEEQEQLQTQTGAKTKDLISRLMSSPDWAAMPDAMKIKLVKKVETSSKKATEVPFLLRKQ